jgi:Na+-translocating ferredoxin:NAD+ oxidoreductase RnfE subunit
MNLAAFRLLKAIVVDIVQTLFGNPIHSAWNQYERTTTSVSLAATTALIVVGRASPISSSSSLVAPALDTLGYGLFHVSIEHGRPTHEFRY